MKTIIKHFIILSTSIALTPLAQSQTKGFYFIGASNMNSRRTNATDLPLSLQSPQNDVSFNYALDAGTYTNLGNATTLRPTIGNFPSAFGGTGFGAEVITGRKLADHFNENIAVIKNGTGSARLATNWAPGGAEYNRLLGQHFAMQAHLAGLGEALAPNTVYMQLGENDVINNSYTTNFQANLSDFINQLRFDLGASDLKFVIQETYWPTGVSSYSSNLTTVQGAQNAIASVDPLVNIIKADDLAFSSDNVHFTSASEIEIGNRFFNATQVPEPSSTALLGLGALGLLARRKR